MVLRPLHRLLSRRPRAQPRLPAPRCRWLVALIFASLAPPSLPAAEEVPISLPPFLVEEPSKGPPWRYGQAMGYELLSRCDDAMTRRIVEAHHRLHQLLAGILPASLQLNWTVPKTLILYDEELQPAASQEVIRQMLRDKPAPPPVELELPGGRGFRTSVPAPRISFLPNIRLWDRDCMTVFMIVRREGFDPERLSLTYDYISFLVKQRVPALPAWFVSGFLDLYRAIEFEGGALRAPPLTWISEPHTDAVKKDPRTAPPVASLAAVFAGTIPATGAEPFTPLQYWRAHAELFVRWGLEPRHARQAAFFAFVERAAREPPTEDLFRACLGLDYAAAQAELTAYLPQAVRRGPRYRPEKLAKLPTFALTPATDAQLARIKGDWERLEVPYVRAISPELGPKYLEQARRTLRRGYERASTDPQLLAVLGLCEVDAGNPAGAREFLEAAAELGPLRPRAAWELARLRLAEARAAPAGEGGRIGVTQLAQVLKPLFEARAGQPPLPEVYDLIAEAWAASSATATRGHLAVLEEGLRLFPRRTSLLLAAAELNLRHGFRPHAAALLEAATHAATDEPARARIAALQARLGPE